MHLGARNNEASYDWTEMRWVIKHTNEAEHILLAERKDGRMRGD